jgi:hypothetical protein
MKLEYVVIKRLSQEEVESAILRNIPEELTRAVLSAALHSDNPGWAEEICLKLTNHESINVRCNAIQGFGHIARIHGRLNESKVKPIIEAALKDENYYLRGEADDTADDVEVYLKWKTNRPKGSSNK